ncbi:hypothetical protein D9613_012428 [Agrocybe pediades]|uniref:Nephrocystin 3-like N-terminal domain-containing protein n=1 Tax=Agrocybe pediades TaxID=84607 RepID=A0A8H4QRD1_9AGAR|nr:hypothetical protein D9613_012428 [Agrocybe pediades]
MCYMYGLAYVHTEFDYVISLWICLTLYTNTEYSILTREHFFGEWTAIEDGVTTATRDRFIFLTGPAGAGKSAIASTIAGRCCEEGRLLASFFFRLADPSRNHSRQFFSTIAYQICIAIPQARNYIAAVIENDPLILKKSLSIQLDSLLINPLLYLMNSGMLDVTGRYCIVIDGLDECLDKEKKARCELLEILISGITRTSLPLVFFIASRPEYDITSVINSQNLANISNRLYLDDKYLPDADIRLYLHDNFNTIKEKHPSGRSIPINWPSDASLGELVCKASGQFIYAATVVKYVSSIQHDPMERLDLVLAPHYNHKDTPFAELDALYMHILSEIEDVETFLRVLSFYRLHTPSYPYRELPIWKRRVYAEVMFQRKVANVLPMLRSNLASLVTVKENHGQGTFCVDVLHASFTDFLCDHRRSGRYYMDLCWWREEHISVVFRYFQRCKSERIFESGTLVNAFSFIGANLNNTSIKTVFNHFSQFSIEDLHGVIFNSCCSDLELCYIIRTSFGILRSFEGLPSSPESSTLYGKLSQVFDKYFRDTLSVFRQTPRLQCFLSILPYATRCSKDRMECIMHGGFLDEGDLGNDLMNIHPQIRSLYYRLRDPDERKGLMPFIADFLKDPNRAGPSALRGMDYIQMALQSLDLLCNATFFEQQHASSRRLARTRRNAPFLSLHKRDSLYRLYKLTGVHQYRFRLLEICKSDYTPDFALFRKYMKTEFRAFQKFLLVGLALCYLPYLLKHSCFHEELEPSQNMSKESQGKCPAYYEETKVEMEAEASIIVLDDHKI